MQVMNSSKEQLLIERLRDLDFNKRQDFFKRMTEKGMDPASLPIVPMPKQPLNVLSYAQQRQWFLWKLEPHSAVYNLPMVLNLTGKIDMTALQFSFDDLLVRHHSLRVVFEEQDGNLMQRTLPASAFLLEFEPLDNPDALVLNQKIADEIGKPFDLETGPLLRGKLIKLGAEEHVLIVVLHHIVTDDWSMQVMVEELVARYSGYANQQPVKLDELTIQYTDYAAWQRQWMESGERQRQLDYWQNKLAGQDKSGEKQHLLDLPVDYPRPVIPSHAAGQVAINIENELAGKIKHYVREEGVSLFVFLLATFQLLLHRYSGETLIRIGVPIANRTRPETHRTIGFFVNTQVLQADFSTDSDFRQLLQQVKQTAQEAQLHQDLPFEQLVAALQPERHIGHTPLFQVMFNHLMDHTNNNATPVAPALLDVKPFSWSNPITEFDLVLDTHEHAQGIAASLTYASELFAEATAERMAQHWLNIINAVIANSAKSFRDINLLDQREQQQLLHEWNIQQSNIESPVCIHQLFEHCVKKNGDALAVIGASLANDDVTQMTSLSYRELNARANRLAHRLRESGVGPDIPVGIAVKRSIEMLVAMLAILKAGGTYVPLDPEYPADRLTYMMENSKLQVLLTQASLQHQFNVPESVAILLLDKPDNFFAYPEHNLSDVANPDNLAYVIYTSGSTGKPKGVAIAHRNTCELIRWSQGIYRPEDLHGVLAATSICFDLSVWEFLVPLGSGGFVIVADNALALPDHPARDQVRLVNTVPSAIASLAQAGTIPASVRIINLAGEALGQALVDQLYDAGIENVYDLYGPSEDTTYSTFTRRTANGRPNIGRPLANTQAYILNTNLQPVPIGVVGELYIAGAGIARGYLHKPALTADKFLPNLFANNGDRLYRTGDLARYRVDGLIEYAGRIDHQVKIRGFRIELEEINAQLQSLDLIRDSAVIAQDSAGGKQLVAYVVPTDATLVNEDIIEKIIDNTLQEKQQQWRNTIKTALHKVLPDYMVPAHVLLLKQLPLTPNGKLDRKALPAVNVNEFQRIYSAPVTLLEKQLAAIWQSVLGVNAVGLDDNFFDLGGHSLLAVQVNKKIREDLTLNVTLHEVMLYQTIGTLANHLRQRISQITSPVVLLNNCTAAKSPLFCIHPAGGSSYPYYPLALALANERPVYGIMCRTFIDHSWVDSDWKSVAVDYANYIQETQATGPYLLLGWSLGGALAQEIASQLEARGEVVNFLGLIDSTIPADFIYADQAKEGAEPKPTREWADRLDEFEKKAFLLIKAFFPSLQHNDLKKQFETAKDQQLHGADAVDAVIQWAATETGIDQEQIKSMMRDMDVGTEISMGYKILENFSVLANDFKSTTCRYQVKPVCWWSTYEIDQKEIESLETQMGNSIAGGGIGASYQLAVDHHNIIYSTEIINELQVLLNSY